MKKAFLKEMKKILEARKRGLLEGTGEGVNGDRNQENDNLPDPTDVATNESDQSFTIRLKEREMKLLAKIDEAIQSIGAGTYGICDQCGEEISENRLRARPVTTLCIACKTKQEELERLETL